MTIAIATYAQVLKMLADVRFADADKIVRVRDNSSTHSTTSLSAAFPPQQARRLAGRFE